MDFKIVNRQILSEEIRRLDISAPFIARRVKAGQFARVRPGEGYGYIPLAVVEADAGRGVISFIVQQTDPSTIKLGEMPIGGSLFSVLGPLGTAAKIEKKGTVFCVATGIGISRILPICRALKKAGNRVIGVIGANTKKRLLFEAQMRVVCDKIYVATDDGSYERRGLATDIFRQLIHKEECHGVYASGTVEMMQTVSALTKEKGIETFVIVNPVMVDCVGMCASCRIKVDGKIVFACVEGPTFDAHRVDFDVLRMRLNAFEEPNTWDSPKLPSSRPAGEEKTFERRLSDIRRS